MKTGFVVHGIQNVKRRLDMATAEMDRLAKTAVSQACLMVLREAVESMRHSGGMGAATYFGRRMYRSKGGGRVWHEASAPGEPPAAATGRLARSMDWTLKKESKTRT